MKRIFHHYNKWEDYKNGMYKTPSKKTKEENMLKVVSFFSDQSRVEIEMKKAINEWCFSMEHNLSNDMMNRVAYLGQAACCISMGIDNISTMYAWKFVPHEHKIKSNNTAEKLIKEWELKKISSNTSISGKNKAMKKEFQMKLLLN